MIQVYNSKFQQKQELVPIIPGKISMYVCGMTVYDFCHIGNARVFVVFDVIARYLRERGFEVTYVRNITDIDDKIIKRANESNEDYMQLAQRFIDALHEDEAAIGILPPDVEPLATKHMLQILELISALIDKGYAYVATNGDVYFDVTKFADYGKFAHQNLDELRQGVRVEVATVKHDPLDFVLWKMSKPHEPCWDSPWGRGRPGWHIECSAMATHYLGNNFDIHGGGMDLQFPHHQNEVAQSCAATGDNFAKYWLHVGYVQLEQKKMSKSLGNFFTLREVLKQHHAETLRYFMLFSHYRSPLNYSAENLATAHAALARLYTALSDLEIVEITKDFGAQFKQRFYAAMDDDFNTPEALAVLFEIVRAINRLREHDKDLAAQYASLCKKLANILGLLQADCDEFFQAGVDSEKRARIEELISARKEARAAKDWVKADKIRDELVSLDVELEDAATKTKWRLKT